MAVDIPRMPPPTMMKSCITPRSPCGSPDLPGPAEPCHDSIMESTLAKSPRRPHSVLVAIAPRRIPSTPRPTHGAPLRGPRRRSPDLDGRDLEYRTRLMPIVTRLIAVSGLGWRESARRAGLPSPKLSDLLSGRLEPPS